MLFVSDATTQRTITMSLGMALYYFSKPLMITLNNAMLVIATLYQSVPSGVISLSSLGWNYLCVQNWAFQTDCCMPQQQSIILNPKPIYSAWRGKYLLISCRQSLIAVPSSSWQSNCAASNGTFILDLQLPSLHTHEWIVSTIANAVFFFPLHWWRDIAFTNIFSTMWCGQGHHTGLAHTMTQTCRHTHTHTNIMPSLWHSFNLLKGGVQFWLPHIQNNSPTEETLVLIIGNWKL